MPYGFLGPDPVPPAGDLLTVSATSQRPKGARPNWLTGR